MEQQIEVPGITGDDRPFSTLETIDERHRLLIKGGAIVSVDPAIGNIACGDVLIEGSRIVSVGQAIESDNAEVIDATNMIVVPGMIDTHRHSWEGQLRRLNANSPNLQDYCNATHFSFARFYRPRDMYIGNLLTAIGCIDSGITTIIDNCHNARSPAHSDSALAALRDSGLRAVFAPGAPITGDWDRESWPGDLRRLKREHFADPEALQTLALFSFPDPENWALARELGIRIVSEFLDEKMTDLLKIMDAKGVIGSDNIFNHCTAIPAGGWDILRSRNVSINVCPRSDTHYAIGDGMFGYQAALDHGMKPALSVDNETSYSGDMFTEMRIAFYLQRSFLQGRRYLGLPVSGEPVSVEAIFEAATINGAHCAGLGDRIGSLTPGKQADILLIRSDDVNLYPSNNVLGTVVQAAERSNIDSVLIGGRFRKRHGEIVGLDRDALRLLTEESREHLFKAADYRPDPFCEHHPNLTDSRTAENLADWLRSLGVPAS